MMGSRRAAALAAADAWSVLQRCCRRLGRRAAEPCKGHLHSLGFARVICLTDLGRRLAGPLASG